MTDGEKRKKEVDGEDIQARQDCAEQSIEAKCRLRYHTTPHDMLSIMKKTLSKPACHLIGIG